MRLAASWRASDPKACFSADCQKEPSRHEHRHRTCQGCHCQQIVTFRTPLAVGASFDP